MVRYIEVFENNEIKTYSSSREIVLIGSGETSHIRIESKTVSKVHAKLTVKGDKSSISDQGSANGTYINDVRLEPGIEYQLQGSDFIRLGQDVLISCKFEKGVLDGSETVLKIQTISNIDLKILKDQDKTISFSNKSLKENSTKKLVKKRSSVERSRNKHPGISKGQLIPLFIISLVLGTMVFWRSLQDDSLTVDTNISEPLKKRPKKKIRRRNSLLLTDRADIKRFETFVKCDSSLEKYLCEKIPETKDYGVVQIERKLNVMIDGDKYLDLARKSMHQGAKEKDLQKIATLYFLHHLPMDLDFSLFEDKEFCIAFYHTGLNQEKKLGFLVNLEGKKVKEIKSKITKGHFKNVKHIGAVAFTFIDDHYTIY